MIYVITRPHVLQGTQRTRVKVLSAAYVFAGVTSGVAIGAMLGGVGLLLGAGERADAMIAVASLACALGVAEMSIRRFPVSNSTVRLLANGCGAELSAASP
jgi:hypothetical protein